MRSVKVKAIIVNALKLYISKRTPFAFQKGSFCTPKRILLHSKTNPFALQNESFCTPKRILLHSKTSPFASQKESF